MTLITVTQARELLNEGSSKIKLEAEELLNTAIKTAAAEHKQDCYIYGSLILLKIAERLAKNAGYEAKLASSQMDGEFLHISWRAPV